MAERFSASPYRIGAAVTAIVLALALLWVAAVTLLGQDIVEPTVRVTAAGSEGASGTGAGGAPVEGAQSDAGGGVLTAETLAARTRLMGPRAEFGPSPDGGAAPPLATGTRRFAMEPGVTDPRRLVESWRIPNDDARPLLKAPARLEGATSLPYANADLFEQPRGRTWRTRHNVGAREIGAWVVLGVSLLLALFLAWRGRVPIAEGKSGRKLLRFGSLERANHWMTATSFLVMALTGLVFLFGRTILQPIVGGQALGDIALVSAWLHMASAIPFTLGVATMIVLWTRANLPTKLDWHWLKQGGGFLDDSGDNPPARKFNAGQKLVFWSVVLGGGALIASGVTLMVPFFLFGLDGMQWAQLIHSGFAVFMIAVIIGHIYIGTVGMDDAFWAMWDGQVDRNWAKEHHSIWYREVTGESGDGDPHAEPKGAPADTTARGRERERRAREKGRPAPSPAE